MSNGPGKIDTKTEYQCAYAYHNDLIKSRFTVAGLYLAATAVIVGKVVELREPMVICCICLVMAFVAFVCICLERRTRALYHMIGRRLAVLEKEGHGLPDGEDSTPGSQPPLFYFCYYQHEDSARVTDPETLSASKQAPVRKVASALSNVARVVPASHTVGFGLLYWGSFVCWFIAALVAAVVSVCYRLSLTTFADDAIVVIAILIAFAVGVLVGRRLERHTIGRPNDDDSSQPRNT
jgi:hypothetical protein